MIPNIKKILYATDLSENARYAFSYAASMAERYDAGVVIMHVVEELSPTALLLIGDIVGEKRWSTIKGEKEQQIIATIRKRLEDFYAEFCRQEPNCRITVDQIIIENGRPANRIIETAETIGADVIVMGSHGQGVIQEVMIGSTSRRVMRRCRQPVLVVRLPENGGVRQS